MVKVLNYIIDNIFQILTLLGVIGGSIWKMWSFYRQDQEALIKANLLNEQKNKELENSLSNVITEINNHKENIQILNKEVRDIESKSNSTKNELTQIMDKISLQIAGNLNELKLDLVSIKKDNEKMGSDIRHSVNNMRDNMKTIAENVFKQEDLFNEKLSELKTDIRELRSEIKNNN